MASNRARMCVRSDLAAGVLPAVVAMLAARADCPIDRLEEALLLTDALAAHGPRRSRDGSVTFVVGTDSEGLDLIVEGLLDGGAAGLLADAALPHVGAVIERVADDVRAESGSDGERLVLRLAFAAGARQPVDAHGGA